jgi:hypothetical protein
VDAKALDKSNIVTVTPSLTPRDRPYKDPGRSTGHSERSKLVNARVGSWKAAQITTTFTRAWYLFCRGLYYTLGLPFGIWDGRFQFHGPIPRIKEHKQFWNMFIFPSDSPLFQSTKTSCYPSDVVHRNLDTFLLSLCALNSIYHQNNSKLHVSNLILVHRFDYSLFQHSIKTWWYPTYPSE